MSPLGHILLDIGLPLFGQDKNAGESFESLKERGMTAVSSPEELEEIRPAAAVFSSAISRTENLFFRKCEELGIPLMHRSELLHRVFGSMKSVSVAGSHGKTTTTAMTAQIFSECGLEPAVMVGGETAILGKKGGQFGKGLIGVYESDESDGTFLNHSADVRIVTNVDNDHLDYYKELDNLFRSFGKHICGDGGGTAVLNLDEEGTLSALKYCSNLKILGFSAEKTDPNSVFYKINGRRMNFRLKGTEYELEVPYPGDHYLKNALSAVLAAFLCGIEIKRSVSILKNYRGVKRRLEYLGNAGDVPVYDDYGHHPTEIKSVISSLSQMKKAGGRTAVVFQPHRYTRTKELYKEFAQVLQMADLLFLLPIYSAGEKPEEGISTELIYQLTDRNRTFLLKEGLEKDTEEIRKRLKEGDVFVSLGAGNVRNWGERLVSS